jgi:hypothetical protein
VEERMSCFNIITDVLMSAVVMQAG